MTTPTALTLLPETDAELAAYYGDAPIGVRANMVQSVDGAGAFHGKTREISDPADQALLRHLRSHADAVVVGGATVQAEGYGPVRLDAAVQEQRSEAGYAELPPIVIVTAHANLSPDLRVFDPSGSRPVIATLASSAETAGALREVADIEVVGDAEIDVTRVVAMLRDRGLGRVLCEGGPFMLSRMIEADIVDDMCLTVSPYLAGSQPTAPQPASARSAPTHLRLRHVLTRNDLLYLRYSRAITSVP